ncbi:DUF397 domain-containing protein [Streptomyces xiamenensis]|uniref:DUF397 domain-containing protein n=1 Tax=Streptomyces xiamenensis TaxID=408015 RepID=UPI0037CD0281
MPHLKWQKSTYSSGNPNSDCLEAARSPEGHLYLRESDDPDTVLVTTPARWAALLRAAGSGATH